MARVLVNVCRTALSISAKVETSVLLGAVCPVALFEGETLEQQPNTHKFSAEKVVTSLLIESHPDWVVPHLILPLS